MSNRKMPVAMLGILLSVAFMPAQAVVIDPVTFSPNHYQCKGNNISVTFGSVGPIGSESLTIKIGNKVYPTVYAPNITTESTLIGSLKEATIKFFPDVKIIDASIIIPTITLGHNALGGTVSSAKFSSQLIITTIATPFIIGPYLGVTNDSKYYNLSCTATFIPIV